MAKLPRFRVFIGVERPKEHPNDGVCYANANFCLHLYFRGFSSIFIGKINTDVGIVALFSGFYRQVGAARNHTFRITVFFAVSSAGKNWCGYERVRPLLFGNNFSTVYYVHFHSDDRGRAELKRFDPHLHAAGQEHLSFFYISFGLSECKDRL